MDGAGGPSGEESFYWGLAMNLIQQNDQATAAFRFSNCDSEQVENVSLKDEYKLYERQQIVVMEMVLIEHRNNNFRELEMDKHKLPGSSRLSLNVEQQEMPSSAAT